MLQVRKLIPPLTLRDVRGNLVHAWDFKPKRNLVIAFLERDCTECETFLGGLIEHAADLSEQEAQVLLVFSNPPESSLVERLPDGFIAGLDVDGRAARDFLGEAGTDGDRKTRAVFVTDRFGEISGLWSTTGHEFPSIAQILSCLNLLEIACEECGVPTWPIED